MKTAMLALALALFFHPNRRGEDSPFRLNVVQVHSHRKLVSFEGKGTANLWDGMRRRGVRFDYSGCPDIAATGLQPESGYRAEWVVLGSTMRIFYGRVASCTLNVTVLDVYYEVDGDGKVNVLPYGVGHQ